MAHHVDLYLLEPLMTSEELESVRERFGNEHDRQEQGHIELFGSQKWSQ